MIDKVKTGMNIMKKASDIGMSQKRLAEEIDIDPKAVNRWVRGYTLPSPWFLLLLSRTLGCSMEELLVESEEDY